MSSGARGTPPGSSSGAAPNSSASTRQAAARNPRWETVMLPGVGHTPQLEAPDNVIGTVRDWLGRNTPGTR